MRSVESNSKGTEPERSNLKRSRSSRSPNMAFTDSAMEQNRGNESCFFPVDEIVQYPLPGYGAPTSISYSPDDKLVAYLFSPDNNLSRKVFVFDVETGKHQMVFSPPDGGLDECNISEAEKLRRERARERGLGVTRYEWVKGSTRKRVIMVPLPDGVYLQDLSSSKLELKLPSDPSAPVIDPHLSPDGTMLAFVRGYELYVQDLLYNLEKQLTSGSTGSTLTHGLAEYIAQEEMDRKNGYWWSMDSKFIAFTEVDSSEIPLYRIMHQGKSNVGPNAEEDHAYPFAGASNVKVRLGVVSVAGGPITWMDLLCGGQDGTLEAEEEYLARVNWMPGNVLIVQVLNRSHTKLKLLKFDISTGKREVLLVEEQKTWINLHDCLTPLENVDPRLRGGFLWASEKTGSRHLYLHDASGACLGPVTEGDWVVDQVAGVDENAGIVYFTGTIDGPMEFNLYSVKIPKLNNPLQRPVRLSHSNGKHTVVLDHTMQCFIDVHDSLTSPPKVIIASLLDGSLITTLHEQSFDISSYKGLQLEAPEKFEVDVGSGTTLFGLVYKPDEKRFGPPPYKAMLSVYGGPSVQLVTDSWISTVDMRAQYLRSKGVLVWKLDNRGSPRRGIHFEGMVKHKFGQTDAEDHLAGANWLIKQGLAKAGHIGVYGWSYGGYLSAMALARFPETFQCAVSGAPVTSWDGYDTFYTEKYMGLPSENTEGYELGSIMHHVSKIKGKLLLVHGMIDENVHFRHTARLVNALVAARKLYELLIFPSERHMPRRLADRIYMEERIWEFIERNL